ncbi:serine/arginine repetitive matrix protein 2 [Anopheles cruzii]|uniref:serine/arginine repetitive matrix protein 2 n=1 Tax=Anopheles cruzii TaxID=68878 RepID=UPI0022EC38F6|nr:serine/arginine repetitive matrix protein 2 [Anopheles cruzii]
MSTAVADGEPATVTPAGNGSASGPRVSFNRDVHVKRIGPRTEPTRVQTPNGAVRKELPENLSQEALRKEAEFVLAQADRIDRRTRSNSAGSPLSSGAPAANLSSDRFNSLPSRTKSRTKRVTRSSSDAASKKPPASGKGGLLNLFGGRKSAASAQDEPPLSAPPRSTTNLGRSKSDVGSSAGGVRPQTPGRAQQRTRVPRRATQELGELRSIGGKRHDPLTPIIEAATPLENAPQVDPLTAFVHRARAVSEEPQGAGRRTLANNAFAHHGMEAGSRSVGNLHSSQLPPEKPHLTKGVTVESIVKRLSSERHSSPPPAQIVSGGFSYTRHTPAPSGTEPEPSCRTFTTSERESAKMRPSTGFLDATQRPSPPLPKYRLDEADHSPRSLFRTVRHTNSDEDEGLGGIDYSRHGHGPVPRYKSSAYLSTSGPGLSQSAIPPPQERTSPKAFFSASDEDHLITPHIRSTPVFGERGSYTTSSYTMHYRGQADGKEHLPEFHELAQRREILESRIRSRIGSRDLLDRLSPERPVPIQLQTAGSAGNGVHYRTTVDRLLQRESPRRTLSPTFREVDTAAQNGLRVTRSSTSKNSSAGGYMETHVTKTVVNRDGKPVSEEYVERRKYPGEAVEAVSTSKTIYDRDGSAGRTEVKRYNRYTPVPEQQTGVGARHVADKGDSGIENDFRKDSFNQEFMVGNRFTLTENVGACEDFLRMERTHTNSCMRKPRAKYAYRERSIDDGSRYDPRLDDISTSRSYTRDPAKPSLKAEKKTGSLAKVKQFVSSTRKKLTRLGTEDKREPRSGSRSGSLRSDSDPSRVPDIATRRRLSTPKSSPSSAKRSLSFSRSSKVSTANSAATSPDVQKPPSTKPDWFKSFDRLSRKKLLSSSKTNVNGGDTKTLPSPAKQTKSLRFFGDTDTEYGEQPSYRSARSNLSKTDKKYRSAHDLDAAPRMREAARNRSSSLHNLDEEDELNLRGPGYRTMEQHSSTLIRTRSPSPPPLAPYSRQERSMSRNRTHHRSRETNIDVVDTDRQRSQTPMRHGRTSEHKKPPVGPPKPARTFERRDSLNRDIDRILDSSGTEGESSQQSQRSVVFLHATTVGDIPHPQIANARRRAYSRESLNQSVASSKKVQPMTRTVSRSISVLAPWKPKNVREGYEIDYHKEQQTKPISTLPRPGTLNRANRDRRQPARDDPDSDKSSAFEQSAGRSSVASEQRRPIGGGSGATPYASTTLPSSRRVKDSIAHYPSRTGGSGSNLKYRR